MRNFFRRQGQNAQQPPQPPPESGEYGAQEPAHRQFPGQSSRRQPQCVGQPQVPAAHIKAQVQPGGSRCQQEDPVGQGRGPGPEGPQKSIDQSQARAQAAGRGEPPRGNGRRRHPSIRRNQPPLCRGSS